MRTMITVPEQPFLNVDRSIYLCDGLVVMRMPASYDEDEKPSQRLDSHHARD